MKKIIARIAAAAIAFSAIFAAASLSASAGTTINIVSDFAAVKKTVTMDQVLTEFPELESSENVRLYYSSGKSYFCQQERRNGYSSIVYKIDVPQGETLNSLQIQVEAAFGIRNASYPFGGEVYVSTDGGESYTLVQNLEGKATSAAYADLEHDNYTVDLKEAAGDASTIHIKLSWGVGTSGEGTVMYASVFKVAITGETGAPSASSEPAVQGTAINIVNDFGAKRADVAQTALQSEGNFPEIVAVENVRIKYASGVGYLCQGNRLNGNASIVYKIDVPQGETLNSLQMKIEAAFGSRIANTLFGGEVSVSADGGTTYTSVQTLEGEAVSSDTSYTALEHKSYTVDLKEAAGDASTVYIKLSWGVPTSGENTVMYASVFKVEITGATGEAAAPSQPEESSTPESSVPEVSEPESSVPEASIPESSTPESSTPESSAPSAPSTGGTTIDIHSNFAAATEAVGNANMLTAFPELEAVNSKVRVLSAFGRRASGMGAGEGEAAELIYKVEIPEGQDLSALGITFNALLVARPDRSDDWTTYEFTPYAEVLISADGTTYTSVEKFMGTRLTETGLGETAYGNNDAVKGMAQDYTADLKDAAEGMSTIYIKLRWVSWDNPQFASVYSVDITGAAGDAQLPTSSTPTTSTPTTSTPDSPTTGVTGFAAVGALVLLAAAAGVVLVSKQRA